jgi:hypothetical protein
MDHIDLVREELDRQLESANENIGVMFGEELFAEFKKRGWLTLETFGALGTSLFAKQVPAYKKTHFAFSSWSIGSLEFKVGQAGK